MKKLIKVLLGTACLTLVVGCSTEQVEKEGLEIQVESHESSSAQELMTSDEKIDILLGTQEIIINMDITEDVISQIGEPLDIIEAPSCHYDGNDTIYEYEDYVLYTYQNGDENNLYIVELATENISTKEGAKIGMSKDEVISLHGDQYTHEGFLLKYQQDNMSIDFTLNENDEVTLIELIAQ